VTPFDFANITEDGTLVANREQREAAFLRYRMAADLTGGGRLVDVACGTGYGLPFVGRWCQYIVAGDINAENTVRTKHALGRAVVVKMDALHLPFRGSSADTVTCLEALYYLPDIEQFVNEAFSLLRTGGVLFVTWPNPRRPAFSPSPGSLHYPVAEEFRATLSGTGFDPEVYGAFSWQAPSNGRLTALERVRHIAVRLGIIPSTMVGRATLKRIIYRDMKPLEAFDAVVDPAMVVSAIPPSQDRQNTYTTLLAVGWRR
jgi:SAM-dependent methyltransferase